MGYPHQPPFPSPFILNKRGTANPLCDWPREWFPLCEGFRLYILSNDFFPEYLNSFSVTLYYGVFHIRRNLARFRHFGGVPLAAQSLSAFSTPPKFSFKGEYEGDSLIPRPFQLNPSI